MLKIRPVPCLKDNYAYIVEDPKRGEAVVVDASEAEPVLAALAERGARLTSVWSTHHHADHVGGNAELARRVPGLRIFGHASDRGRIPGQTEFLSHGDTFGFGDAHVRALHIPGHTLGAVAFVIEGAVFTGDTLFLGGCGRLFEGTPEMMFRSLNEVLGALDGSTRVFCGHEYTVSNLTFALGMEPDNAALATRLERSRAVRARGADTMGATLEEERATNPFLRCQSPSIRAQVGLGASASDVEVFAAVRAAKDRF